MAEEPKTLTPEEIEILRATTFLKAALPLLEEVAESDEEVKKMIAPWNFAVQLQVKTGSPAAYVLFENGTLKVEQGKHANPLITMTFKEVKLMNDFFAGKMVLPSIKGLNHPVILIKFLLKLFMKLKMLMPEYKCKNEAEKELKVRMLIYMVSFALQEMSRGGDEYVYRMTKTAHKKIVEFLVLPEGPAAYIKINEGVIKGIKGRTNRRPYCSMDFKDLESALMVLTNQVGPLDANKQGLVTSRGTPEYSIKIGGLMQRVNNFLMEEG